MHATAWADAERFVNRYLADRPRLKVADVGSYDVNGALRPLFQRPGWDYCGLDAVPGPNVDHVLSSAYSWPEIADGTFDIVVSTQTLEHVPHPWRWLPEVARICAPGGLIYLCSPNTWGYHGYPSDCWRVWPDGLRALMDEAGLEPLDVYANGPDTTGIARRRTAAEQTAASVAPPLTVLCLTIGRPTLRRTLESLRDQDWRPGDGVWLVHDGVAAPETRALWQEFHLPGRWIELDDGPHGDWGHTPRNRILPQIPGGYVINLDDDDAFVPDALRILRQELQPHPGAFFLFRIAYPHGECLWRDQAIREGNVGTPIFVHPAGIPLGTYTSGHSGDFDFVASTLQKHPDRRVIWSPTCHYLIRPHEVWRNPQYIPSHECGGERGREDFQAGWQQFFGRRFQGQAILDVGAGLAHSRARLQAGGNRVTTQDLASGLPVDLCCPISEIPDQAYDIVTAFNVLEHVDDADAFLQELQRIARTAVVITTPNVWASQRVNRFHIREYSPPVLWDRATRLTGIERIEALASVVRSGEHPTPLPPELFLRTTLPVLAIILWKMAVTVTASPPLELAGREEIAVEHEASHPVLSGSPL